MMINDSQRQHIARLKQQPRHGADPDWTKIVKQIGDDIKQLGPAVQSVVRSKVFGTLQKEIESLTSTLTILEQRNTGLQKSLNLNREAAAELGYELDGYDEKLNPEKLRDYTGELNKLTKGFSKQLIANKANNKQFIKDYYLMRNQLKLTEEQSIAITRFTAATKKHRKDKQPYLDDLASEIAKIEEATKTQGLYTDALEQLGDAGEYIQMAYSKAPAKLAQAAAKANLLGMSFKELVATSNKFLDIESSIGAELEMQLLSGKKINSEKFRQAAVEQDMNKMADAMKELMDTMGEDAMDNVFVQQSLTNLTGLEADALAKVQSYLAANSELIQDSAMTWDQITTAAEKYAGTVSDAAKEAAKEDKRDTSEQMEDDLAIRMGKSVRESFESAEKAADAIADVNKKLIDGQQTLIDGAEYVRKNLLDNDFVNALVATTIGIGTASDLMNSIKSGGQHYTGTSATTTESQKKDVYISPAVGNAIYSSKENALFPVSPRDEIAAAPGLGAMLSNRGGDTPAFNVYVTNKFELDQLITAVDIRRSERMNG